MGCIPHPNFRVRGERIVKGDRFVSVRGALSTSYRRLRVCSIMGVSSCNLPFLIIMDDAQLVVGPWPFLLNVDGFFTLKY